MQQLNTNYDNLLARQADKKDKIKKRCLWCYNGCKNKKVYTSHSMKNHKGEVTCPKLLKTICRNCGKSGHAMGKFCLEAQKPMCDLLPAPRRKFYIDRWNDSYTPGDSDYFPDSSDDEKNTNKLQTTTTPEIMQSICKLAPANQIVVSPPQTWASKLFAI